MGFSFALDDFGSGMSSFSYLKHLAVDSLKIDGVFIKNIENEPIDYSMVRSINEIGHVMGIKTVAEFVESEAVSTLLKDLGVDFLQGYHIHKPAPLNDLVAARRKLSVNR
jgi:EAL domain-containing protein (putative c-di-GMP-specific phosphodiesterase class I)